MKRLHSIFVVLAICGLCLVQAGCLAVAAAAGTGTAVAYVRGDTETSLPGNPKTVTAATDEALKEMGLIVISQYATDLDGKVVARNASDTPVTIVVKAGGAETSRVSIRIGRFGNTAEQATILEKIKSKLPAQSAEKPVETAKTE